MDETKGSVANELASEIGKLIVGHDNETVRYALAVVAATLCVNSFMSQENYLFLVDDLVRWMEETGDKGRVVAHKKPEEGDIN